MDVVVTTTTGPATSCPTARSCIPASCGYPADLCATGVAFKLAQALFAAAGRDPAELDDELDIVALATVADLVPLRGREPHARPPRACGRCRAPRARACAR